AHRSVTRGVTLADVLCPQEERVVGEDWCVRFANRIFQIEKRHEALALAGRKVVVLRRADGTMKIWRGEKVLRWTEVKARPAQPPKQKLEFSPKTPWRPGPEHPWKRLALNPPPGIVASPVAPTGKFFRGVVKPVPLHSVSLRSPSLRSTGLTTPPP